jgi:hypothetical protein
MSKNVFTFENIMKELNNTIETTQTEKSVGYEQQQMKDKFIGSLNPGDGHIIWKIDTKTLFIEPVTDEDYISTIGFDEKPRRRIMVKSGYLYCSALNKKNAMKRFGKMFKTIYGTETIPQATITED